ADAQRDVDFRLHGLARLADLAHLVEVLLDRRVDLIARGDDAAREAEAGVHRAREVEALLEALRRVVADAAAQRDDRLVLREVELLEGLARRGLHAQRGLPQVHGHLLDLGLPAGRRRRLERARDDAARL